MLPCKGIPSITVGDLLTIALPMTLTLTIYLIHGYLRYAISFHYNGSVCPEALPERALPRKVPQAFPQQPKQRYRDDLALTP